MTFFTLDPTLAQAVEEGNTPVKIRLEIIRKMGESLIIPREALVKGEFHSVFDSEYTIITRAELTLDGEKGEFPRPRETGLTVKIFFSVGSCDRWLHRFTLYPDDRGFRRIREGGENLTYRVTLEDTPARLKRENTPRDWTTEEILIDHTFSDKTHPETSLFHRIAAKAGLTTHETESCLIPLMLPYIRLDRDLWEELTDLATGSRALLEGGIDKKLILSQSPWETGAGTPEEPEQLSLNRFYRMEEGEDRENYFNEIRLRWHKPERLALQTLWTYTDPPVTYDTDLHPSYPLRVNGEKRAIENPAYYAEYRAYLSDGTEVTVLYTESVTAQLTADPGISLSELDTTDPVKAGVLITCSQDGDLTSLTLSGTPIVKRENSSCYRRDESAIASRGLKVMNVTGRYFSDSQGETKPHFEEWTEGTLTKHLLESSTYRLYSDYPWFHCRTGAAVILNLMREEIPGRVEEFLMTYEKKGACLTEITIREGHGEEEDE